MSKLYENDYGIYISHQNYINEIYKNMDTPLEINPKLFSIKDQYKVNKNNNNSPNNKFLSLQKEQEEVKTKFALFMKNVFEHNILDCHVADNKDALNTAEYIYGMSGKFLIKNAQGANIGPATMKNINDANFLFPENAVFFSKDVSEIGTYLDQKYDVVLLDPPWWNKYIRRKRKKSKDAYDMLFNNDIKSLPVEMLLKDNGMVVVWCTNSQRHIDDLLTNILPKWNVQYIGKWYWVKVTLNGQPVCPFSLPPGKQPYEQIIFGCRGDLCQIPFTSKLVVSVPSAIHSHKPPLYELLKKYLPENPSCLEIFARYLLPNWTSYGNEVLRLQHESLFIRMQ